MEKPLIPQRKDEHGKDAVVRLLKGVSIPSNTHHALINLANSFEAAKGQLRGHVQESRKEVHHLNWRLENVLGALCVCEKDIDQLNEKLRLERSAHERMNVNEPTHGAHEVEIQNLKNELERERTALANDSLQELYTAATKLIDKQTEEIKRLKDEVKREKEGNKQMKMFFALKISEDDKEKASLMETVQRLEGRLASLTVESTDAEADLRRRLAESESQAKVAFALVNKVQNSVSANGKTNGRAATSNDVELLVKLCMMEQRCESYCSTMADQQKEIERLTKEKSELADELGGRHQDQDRTQGYGPVRYTG